MVDSAAYAARRVRVRTSQISARELPIPTQLLAWGAEHRRRGRSWRPNGRSRRRLARDRPRHEVLLDADSDICIYAWVATVSIFTRARLALLRHRPHRSHRPGFRRYLALVLAFLSLDEMVAHPRAHRQGPEWADFAEDARARDLAARLPAADRRRRRSCCGASRSEQQAPGRRYIQWRARLPRRRLWCSRLGSTKLVGRPARALGVPDRGDRRAEPRARRLDADRHPPRPARRRASGCSTSATCASA